MKGLLIYFCCLTSINHGEHKLAGVVDFDKYVTAYIYPYGYTDFEIVHSSYQLGLEQTSHFRYKQTIHHGTFDLKHPHGYGVMRVTSDCVILFVYLTDGQNAYSDILVMTRKNIGASPRKVCKCKI